MLNKLAEIPLKKALIIVVAILIVISLYSCLMGTGSSAKFITEQVTTGDLEVTVNATGTIEPEELIDVGAQVAGRIINFGTDLAGKVVDYGSIVEADSLLAQIDDSVYAADVSSARAQLQRAEADLLQIKAKLLLAEQNWQRAQTLGASEALSKTSYQTFQAEYNIAKANVTVGEAAIVQAQATLTKAERNLSFCTIKSPVRGVIIDRRVNIGQTVVSSLNAPSLFLLAKDLTKMQVWVAVNEADIGQIVAGQQVKFSVDTFPGLTFDGTVGKIRLNASMTQNVVTYIVEVNTDNSSGKLLPYLTANVEFQVSSFKDATLVPNAALRWKPKPDLIDPKFRNASTANGQATIWALSSQGYVKPITVEVFGTDNVNSAIKFVNSEAVSNVVIAEQQLATAENSGVSPFTPQMRRR